MKHETKKPWLNRLRMVLGAAALSVLAGCGGGEGAASISGAPSDHITGEVKPNVQVIQPAVISATSTQITQQNDGGFILSSNDDSVKNLKPDSIIYIPKNEAKGVSIPVAGRVVSSTNASGVQSVKIVPAMAEDVYKSLSWDFDTTQTGAKVVGVIARPGAKINLSDSLTKEIQTGVTLNNSLNYKSGMLSGEISLEHEFKNKLTMKAKVNIDKLSVRSKGKLEWKEAISDNEWVNLSSIISGELSGSVSFNTPTKYAVDVSSFQQMLMGEDIWSGLKWSGAGVELEGLKSTDKLGKYPLGGLVIVPGVFAQTFTGTLGSNTLQLFANAPATVVWLYMDASGKVSIEGEAGFRLTGYHFENGFELKMTGLNLEPNLISNSTPGTVDVYGQGKSVADQRLGISIYSDIFIGGIRPGSMGVFLGAQVKGDVTGDGGYTIYPTNKQGAFGSVCLKNSLWAGGLWDVAARIKTKVNLWLVGEVDKVKEYKYSGKMVTWYDGSSGICNATGSLAMKADDVGVDIVNTKNRLVSIDFSESFADGTIRPLADIWTLTATDASGVSKKFTFSGLPEWWTTIPSGERTDIASETITNNINNGIAKISLPAGKKYTLNLNITSKKYGDIYLGTSKDGYSITIDLMNNVKTCILPQVLQGDSCVTPVPTCTATQTLVNNQCVTKTCSTGQTLASNGQCVTATPTCTYPQVLQGNTCVTPAPTCTINQTLVNNQCVTKTCPTGQNLVNGACIAPTPTTSSRYAKVGNYDITECVKDTQTGLIWEGKTASGWRAGTNTYTNYDSNYGTAAQIAAANNSITYVNAVNTASLCGFSSGWRMPTIDELRGLVKTGVGSPTIDTTWFPNTPSDVWSGSPNASSASNAWGVGFVNGDFGGNGYRLIGYGVRLVHD